MFALASSPVCPHLRSPVPTSRPPLWCGVFRASILLMVLPLALPLIGAAGCGAAKPTGGAAAVGVDGGNDAKPAGGDAAAGMYGGDDAKSAGGAAGSGMAVLGSDFAVTTVSLYDPVSTKLLDACVHSASGGAVLVQPLSGDVTLPSESQLGGELVVIDRKNAVISFVNPSSCAARAQISVSTGGFKANPRDIITVSAHKAYVTRYETNAKPTADPADFDEGDDLLVIDPQIVGAGSQPVLARIPLASYAVGPAGSGIQARPDRVVFSGGKVYVTLGNLNADFSAAGPGRVVIIDPVTDTVTGAIDLPAGMKGCSAIAQVATSTSLYVACGGSFSDANQAAGSGLVEIDLSGTTPTSKVVVPASAVGNMPLNPFYAAVLGEIAFVGTLGVSDFKTGAVITPDAFYAVPLRAGATATKLLDGGAYNFGRVAVDAVHKQVLLPDGDAVTPLVHVFDVSVDPPVAVRTFEANPGAHLAPREIAWY